MSFCFFCENSISSLRFPPLRVQVVEDFKTGLKLGLSLAPFKNHFVRSLCFAKSAAHLRSKAPLQRSEIVDPRFRKLDRQTWDRFTARNNLIVFSLAFQPC